MLPYTMLTSFPENNRTVFVIYFSLIFPLYRACQWLWPVVTCCNVGFGLKPTLLMTQPPQKMLLALRSRKNIYKLFSHFLCTGESLNHKIYSVSKHFLIHHDPKFHCIKHLNYSLFYSGAPKLPALARSVDRICFFHPVLLRPRPDPWGMRRPPLKVCQSG